MSQPTLHLRWSGTQVVSAPAGDGTAVVAIYKDGYITRAEGTGTDGLRRALTIDTKPTQNAENPFNHAPIVTLTFTQQDQPYCLIKASITPHDFLCYFQAQSMITESGPNSVYCGVRLYSTAHDDGSATITTWNATPQGPSGISHQKPIALSLDGSWVLISPQLQFDPYLAAASARLAYFAPVLAWLNIGQTSPAQQALRAVGAGLDMPIVQGLDMAVQKVEVATRDAARAFAWGLASFVSGALVSILASQIIPAVWNSAFRFAVGYAASRVSDLISALPSAISIPPGLPMEQVWMVFAFKPPSADPTGHPVVPAPGEIPRKPFVPHRDLAPGT